MRRSNTLLLAMAMVISVAGSAARAETEWDIAHAHPLMSGFASDPYLNRCVNPYTSESGFCLYTSHDTGYSTDANNSGFMMLATRVFFSRDGVSYQDEGIVFEESMFSWVVQKPGKGGPYHLWAPDMAVELVNGQRIYHLLVPDLMGTDVNRDSAIGIAESSSPFGPFIPKSNYITPHPGYMSDPEVFPAGEDTSATGGTRYLLWANGTGDTCGGISIAPMNSDWQTLASQGQQITFNNLPSFLQRCPADKSKKQISAVAYMEGASLFDLKHDLPALKVLDVSSHVERKYMIVLPAAPTDVPPECGVEGEPGGKMQVLIYALSDNVMGPYDYQGIIMCGSGPDSNKNEFTNQATLAQITTPSGDPRVIVVYHDGTSTNPPRRQVFAECLYAVDGQIAVIDRNTRDGLSWCMNNSPIFALRSTSGKGLYVQENSYDGNNLRVNVNGNANRIGTWEQFTLTPMPNPKDPTKPELWAIQARLTRQYVSANLDGDGRLSASRNGILDWEKFRINPSPSSDGTVTLQASNGKYVRVSGDKLLADQGSTSGAEKFKMVYLW